jgi:hypothetical protein
MKLEQLNTLDAISQFLEGTQTDSDLQRRNESPLVH